MDGRSLEAVVDAFREERVNAREEVIRQGSTHAEKVYLVDSGMLDAFKKKSSEEPHPGTKVFTYEGSGAFGELAMLYNCPRAATVIAATTCLLWTIDRGTFNALVKASAQKKRQRTEDFLKTVKILETLNAHERSNVCDVATTRYHCAGDVILRQGDLGDAFYIVEEGVLEAYKEGVKVMTYGPRDYFGELALLRNERRHANVKAVSDCILVSIDRESFGRLLGPLDGILKARAKEYYDSIPGQRRRQTGVSG
jgi:cAMP-dependent protein kinase regulator